MIFNKPNSASLPDDFMFGVATADHQCEAYDERFADIQDLWEQERNLTKREKATDFWNRYKEDIILASELGCKAFRFSLAWSRLEPSPGQFSDDAFAHYSELIKTIREYGMEPVTTLHHYTWPVHIEKRGGSIAPDFPALFSAYTSEVVKRLGDLITYWITFNEPNQLVYGYFKTGDYKLPPGLPFGTTCKEQMQKVRMVIPNIFKAHKAARDVIKQNYPGAKVGANPFLLGLPRFSRWFVDWEVSNLKEASWEKKGYRYTEHSPLWHTDVDFVVAMLSITPERREEIDFSEVYYVDGQRLLTSTVNKISSFGDLNGKRIAVIKGSTAEDTFVEFFPNSKSIVFTDTKSALQALDSNTISAVLNDESVLKNYLTADGKYHFIGERLTEERYAVGVPKGNPLLLDALNLTIENFRAENSGGDSVYQNYSGKITLPQQAFKNSSKKKVLAYLNNANPSPGPFQVAGALPLAEKGSRLRKIQDRGYIKAAVKKDVPGFGYFDPTTNQFSGLEIDLAKKLAKTIFGDDSKIKFVPITTKKRLPGIRSIFQIFDPILQCLSILTTIFNSNWWNLGMAGKLPEFLCPAECAHQQDFVGFDYYWGVKYLLPRPLIRLGKAGNGKYSSAPVWPGGLYNLLKIHYKLFPDQEIIVVENGCVINACDVSQADYLKMHLAQIKRALAEGIKIKGYLCWSITTNREWGLKLGPDSDFGLYRIDLDNDPMLTRKASPAVEVYKDIIKSSTV
jgi:beta-glucosidase/6-phospho-beta-glucosidase/beta-galactosidase/ABC-type amino acid transport substrate-binding protein